MDGAQLSRELETLLGCAPLLRVNGKAPLDLEWSTGPRRDPDVWRARLEGHHGNLGMLTGNGLFVVDVDLYHEGAQGALDELYDRGLPRETWTVLTGRGGMHLYYRTPVPIASRPLPGFDGIDIKGEGGQVVIPPSVHAETGRAYEWECGYGPGDDIEIATPPAALLELFAGAEPAPDVGELDERDETAVNLLLEHFEAHSPNQRAGYVELCRPGKERGVSATVGYVGHGVTKVWSSNWPQLPAGVYDLAELRVRAGVPAETFTIKDAPDELPDGYRLWEPADDELPDPTLGRAAYHGPVGAYLDLIEGQSEAHPAAVGIQLLASLGTLIGRRAVYRAGDIAHHCNLFAAVVGPSSEGAKGVADATALALLLPLVPSFLGQHTIGGLGSGEALVRELADDQEPPTERRRIVFDAELSSVLKVIRRDGSILGDILRKAYDYHPLRHSTVSHKSVVASDHHIALVGSITPDELRSLIDAMSIANGLGNRFLYVWSRMSAWLPYGGEIDPVTRATRVDELQAALTTLEGRLAVNGSVHFPFSPDARERWGDFYRQRRTGIGEGITRALSARHVAHAARLSLIYAVLDGGLTIRDEHVEAAIAWCDYSHATVGKAFSCALGGKADVLLRAVRAEMPDGIYGSTLHAGLAHHWKAGELAEVRQQLEDRHLLHVISESSGGGRPRDRYVALSKMGGK